MAVIAAIFLVLMFFSAELRLRQRFSVHPKSWTELVKEVLRKHPDRTVRSLRFAIVVSFSFTFWERILWSMMGQNPWWPLMILGCAGFSWLLYRRIQSFKTAQSFIGLSHWFWAGLLGAWVFVMQPLMSGPLCLSWLLILSERARRRKVAQSQALT
jgi:hypothetical protein